MGSIVLGIILGIVVYFVLIAPLGQLLAIVAGIVVFFLVSGGITFYGRRR